MEKILKHIDQQIKSRERKREVYKDDPDQVTAFNNQLKMFTFMRNYVKNNPAVFRLALESNMTTCLSCGTPIGKNGKFRTCVACYEKESEKE